MRRLIAVIMVSILLVGCTTVPHPKPNRKFLDAYTHDRTENRTETIKIDVIQGLRNRDDAVPIVLPPVVRPFWIVDHVSKNDVFVRGHWVFLKVRGFEWYIQAIERNENIEDVLRENR